LWWLELSYSIGHLNAVSGDMFSASHNLPSDNGKKVYGRRREGIM
jgi:phosphoglucomutase/phosphomannomutase